MRSSLCPSRSGQLQSRRLTGRNAPSRQRQVRRTRWGSASVDHYGKETAFRRCVKVARRDERVGVVVQEPTKFDLVLEVVLHFRLGELENDRTLCVVVKPAVHEADLASSDETVKFDIDRTVLQEEQVVLFRRFVRHVGAFTDAVWRRCLVNRRVRAILSDFSANLDEVVGVGESNYLVLEFSEVS